MSVTLHPTKGLNPHLTICVRCGADVGIALVGDKTGVYKCRDCERLHLGGRPKNKTCVCGSFDSMYRERELEEREKIPDGLCKTCEDRQAKVDDAVREGGVYWKCADCHSTGALVASSELAKKVREMSGIEAPKPVGLEFTKDDCPVCNNLATPEADQAT